MRLSLVLWLALATLLPCLTAADIAGRIRGAVHDASGAAVPGAPLTARNETTGLTATAASGADGLYGFESLPPGLYTVTCDLTGFKRFVGTGVQVINQQVTTLHVSLEVGNVAESIEVTAAASQVDTANPVIQTTLSSSNLLQLPIASRDPRLAIELLQPGAVAGESESNGFQRVRVNGSRGSVNNYKIDGTENVDYFHGTANVMPAVENLQELSLQTSLAGAQSGSSAGAQVTAVIKSGTNDLHGVGWAYLTNSGWTANSWQGNRSGAGRPDSKQRWYGFNVGGPVILPGAYDGRNRTFFFFSLEHTKPSTPRLAQQRLLTAEERAGDFTNSRFGIPKIDGVPTPRISPALFSPMARAFLANEKLMPVPTAADGTYTWTSNLSDSADPLVAKVDQVIGSNHRVFATLFWSRQLKDFENFQVNHSNSHAMRDGVSGNQERNLQNWSFNHTWTISPNALNNAVLGIKRSTRALQRTSKNPDLTWEKLGMPQVRPDNGADSNQVQIIVNGGTANGFRYWAGYEDQTLENVTYLADNFTLIKGRHNLQAGFELRMHSQEKLQNYNGGGQYSFAVANLGGTGNPFADFLLGRAASFLQDSVQELSLSYPLREFYAQDQIRVSRKLTITAGLRWTPFLGVREQEGRLGAFRAGQQSKLFPNAPLGLVFPGDAGVSLSSVPNRYGNVGPRVGLAYDLRGDGKMSIRAGYGLYYDSQFLKTMNPFATMVPYGNAYRSPLPVSTTVSPYGSAQVFPYTKPLPGSEAASKFVFPSNPVNVGTFSDDYNSGRMHQWNASYQVEPWKKHVFTVAYVGSRGTHLSSSQNLNAPAFVPGGSTNTNQQGRRPYGQFQDIYEFFNGTYSRYNSLQVSAERRFGSGLALQGNYVWSRAMDDGDPVGASYNSGPYRNPRDRSIDYGLSSYDTPHSFTMNYVWQLPFPTGANSMLRRIAGDWTVSGMVRSSSGSALTITSPGTYNVQSGSGWANYVGGNVYGNHDSRASQAANWLNPAAFCPANTVGAQCTADPKVGVEYLAFGNSWRGIARGPGRFFHDMTLAKRILLTERLGALEARLSAFNVFNHTVLNNPDTSIANRTTTFGTITSAAPGRSLQLSLRYQF